MKKAKRIFALLLAVAMLFCLASCGETERKSSPFEYSVYSEAIYKSYEKASQYVEMSDGTKLAVDIYLPSDCKEEAADSFPTVFQYTPYGRAYAVPEANLITRIGMKFAVGTSELVLDRANSFDTCYGSSDAIVNYLLSHGYAYVCADVRGTGASYGVKKDFMPEIATDGKELIDWIASQEWSDGNVGMFGGSYLGYTQFVVAGQQPEALKCIFPEVVPLDGYTGEIRPGGIFLNGYSTTDMQTYLEMNCYMPDDWIYPTAPVIDEDGDGDYEDEMPLDLDGSGSFLDDYNYPEDPDDEPQYKDGNKREHIYYMATYEHKENVPYSDVGGFAPFIDSEVDFGDGNILSTYDVGPSASLESIMESGIAVYSHGSWMDPFVRGATEVFCTLQETNPSKIIIDPGYHETYSPYWEYCGEDQEKSIEAYKYELLRFFDRYLKGIENGIDTEDPVYIYNMNGDGWRSEKEWPLARQQETEFYFGAGNTLSTSKAADGKDNYKVDLTHDSSYETEWYDYGVSRYMMCEPDEVPDRTEKDTQCLTYTTQPLIGDTEVTGYPIVEFYVSSTSDDADFYVYLEDVDEDGNAVLVTEGLLRAGFAELQDNDTMINGGESNIEVLPELPWHGYEEEQYNAEIFADNAIVKLTFDLYPTSWTFKAGHSIRVSIACADSPTFETNKALDENTVVTIYRDAEHQSKITLPIIPD